MHTIKRTKPISEDVMIMGSMNFFGITASSSVGADVGDVGRAEVISFSPDKNKICISVKMRRREM